jgi:hypothetical protein
MESGNYCVFHLGYLVIKNIAYFPSQCARNAGPVMDVFLDSCRAAGIVTQENSWTSDAAVIWSVLWHGRMVANRRVYQHYRDQGRPVIVIDVGALYRGITWKIAVNHINAQGYYGHDKDLDWDRPRRLGISLGYTIPGNPAVLIALQHHASLQVTNLGSQEDWIMQQIGLVRQHTDRPIVIRPHPRSAMTFAVQDLGVTMESPVKIQDSYDDFNLRFDYQALINYNSGPGIQAAIEGCPVIVDTTSLAYPISIDHSQIEQRPLRDREQWLVEICHTEYTLQEIHQGLWLKRTREHLC